MASPVVSSPDLIRVKVGSGQRAHLFRPHPGANVKANALREGQVVYDIVVCGARGELRQVDDDLEDCASCTASGG